MMEKLKNGARKLGLELNKRQLERFQTYFEELVEWNTRINLTSVTDCEEVQIIHFLDSLTVISGLDKPFFNDEPKIIDVGTGAGLPGIPLLIAFPNIRLTLLEATRKKTGFLKHIADKLGLGNVEIIQGRAENAGHDEKYREAYDVALSRAVAPLAVLVELALPFCKTGGCLIAQKKGNIREEISGSTKAIETLGGRLKDKIRIDLEEFSDSRYLVVVEKIRGTTSKYPRRPGIPAKRPLA